MAQAGIPWKLIHVSEVRCGTWSADLMIVTVWPFARCSQNPDLMRKDGDAGGKCLTSQTSDTLLTSAGRQVRNCYTAFEISLLRVFEILTAVGRRPGLFIPNFKSASRGPVGTTRPSRGTRGTGIALSRVLSEHSAERHSALCGRVSALRLWATATNFRNS